MGLRVIVWHDRRPFDESLGHSSALEDQASFRVRYDFSGPQFQKYHDLYRLHSETFSLPKTWSVEPGTTDIGHDYSRGEWIFHGLISTALSSPSLAQCHSRGSKAFERSEKRRC